MPRVTCAACLKQTPERRRWTLPDRHWSSPATFDLAQCGACGLLYLNPQPSWAELEPHYPPATYQELSTSCSGAMRWRLDRIGRHKAGGRLLDVGCASGTLLLCAQQRGWEVQGCDTSTEGISIARAALGDRVRQATLEEARYPADTFDVACLFEVLEHLPNPGAALREIHRILKPGGIVCLSVPNFASWEQLIFGRWWNGLDAPRHLYQFTPATLHRLLRAAGFAVRELRSVNACRIQTNQRRTDYCRQSLRFLLRDRGWYPPAPSLGAPAAAQPGPAARRPLWKAALQIVEWSVFGPFCALASLADRDNSIWACAAK